MENYYTPEQMKQFAAVGEAVGAEEIAAVEQAWAALLADVRANRDLDPAEPEGGRTGRSLGRPDRADDAGLPGSSRA